MCKKRLTYGIVFIVLLTAEVLIALFVHDRFIRPYVGDALVTVLLCCFLRIFWPEKGRGLALWVFLFSVIVEILQLANLPALFGMEGHLIKLLLGSTFDFLDILCYFCGCALFFLVEWLFKKRKVR